MSFPIEQTGIAGLTCKKNANKSMKEIIGLLP